MKILVRFLLYCAILVTILYVTLLVPPIKHYIENRLQRIVAEKTGLQLTMKDLSWRPPFTIVFHDVQLKKAEGQTLFIERLDYTTSLSEILRIIFTQSTFEVSDLKIQGLQIYHKEFNPINLLLKPIIFEGSFAYEPISDTLTAQVTGQKKAELNCPGKTTLFLSLQKAQEKYNTTLTIDEEKGGVLLNPFCTEWVDSSSFKIFASSDQTFQTNGRIEFEVKGKDSDAWKMETIGDFHMGDEWKISLSNELKGFLDGKQNLSLIINPITHLASGTLDATFSKLKITASSKGTELFHPKIDNLQATWEGIAAEGTLDLSLSPLQLEGKLDLNKLNGHIQFILGKSFQVHYEEKDALDTELDLEGEWSSSLSKIAVNIKELKGHIAQHLLKLQKSFEISYENEHLSLTPILTHLSESTLYAALNEIENGYELSTYALNIPSTLINSEEDTYWNLKAHLRWLTSLEQLNINLSAAKKDSNESTTIQLSLHPMTGPPSLGYLLDIHHPRQGLLTLLSSQATNLQANLQSEGTIDHPSILALFKDNSTLRFSGNTSLYYTLPETQGHITTFVQGTRETIQLKNLQLKDHFFESIGNLIFDIPTQHFEGKLNILTQRIPLKGILTFAGTSKQFAYAWSGEYSPENPSKPISFYSQGQLTNSKLIGNIEADTSWNDLPLTTDGKYTLTFTPEPNLDFTLQAIYNDDRKSATRLGNLNIKAHFIGPPKSLNGEVTITGSKTILNDNPLPSWVLTSTLHYPDKLETLTIAFENSHKIQLVSPWTLEWKESSIHLPPLQLRMGKGTLEAEGYATNDDFKLFFKGRDLPLAPTSPPINAKLALEGAFEGPWNSPQGLLHLSLEDLQWIDKFYGKSPICHASVDLALKPSLTTLQGELLCSSIEPVTFHAKIPSNLSLSPFNIAVNTEAPFTLDLKASGAVGPLLDILVSHTAAVNGFVSLSLQATGTLTNPQITGIIALNDGSYENLETGTFLHNITLKARAEGSSIQIEQLEANDNKEGTLRGNGKFLIDKANNYPFEIHCDLNKILLLQTDNVSASIDGNLLFKGDKNGAVISGTVLPVSTMLYIPEEIPENETVEVTYINVPKGKEKKNNFESSSSMTTYPITFDLDVKTSNRLHIHGRGLESAWRGQAHLTGPITNPNVQGELKVQKGNYNYKGKIFDIYQGTIIFAGPWETKTKLYVIASLEIDDILVEAILRGALKNPTLTFRSNPPMPQREIVSHLLFGTGSADISAYQGNELSRSISNLSQGDDTPDILTQVRNQLNIDRLDINREVTSEGDKVSVQLGKYICKGVYVSLNRSLTEESNSIAVDANVVHDVRAHAEVTDNAETKLLLKWKHHF